MKTILRRHSDDTKLRTLKELDNGAYFLTVGHLFLYLSNGIMRTGLAMEHQSIGICDMGDDILSRSRRLKQLDVQSAVSHRVVCGYDKRRHVLGDTHTRGDERTTAYSHSRIDDYRRGEHDTTGYHAVASHLCTITKCAIVTYLEVISAQSNLLNAQISQVTDDFNKMQAVVTLYSALGGGRE